MAGYRIFEIGCGIWPVAWSGELAYYEAVDPVLAYGRERGLVCMALAENPAIESYALIAGKVEDIEAALPADEVYLANVLGTKPDQDERLTMLSEALRFMSPRGQVVCIENVRPEVACLEELAGEVADMGYDARALCPGEDLFDELWAERQPRQHWALSDDRMLVIRNN